jgi:hypothetical protein
MTKALKSNKVIGRRISHLFVVEHQAIREYSLTIKSKSTSSVSGLGITSYDQNVLVVVHPHQKKVAHYYL